MPLLAYFSVVGSVLLGLLFVAEAQLGPSKPLTISTDFHGLPAPWKAPAAVSILTVREAPVPEAEATKVEPAKVAAAEPAAAPPPPKIKTAKAAKSKKARSKTARNGSSRNRYAHSAVARPPSFGFVW